MESIHFEHSDKTPMILLDAEKGLVEIEGRSSPEDSSIFYKPVINWLDEYIKEPRPISTLRIKLEYFNTSSSKCILGIMNRFRILFNNGKQIKVEWFYDKEELLEIGEDFAEKVKIPIHTIKL